MISMRFEPGYDVDTANQVVAFMATVDYNWIFCLIAYQALSDCFGSTDDSDAERAFVDNRQAIETASRVLIEAGLLSVNQEVFVTCDALTTIRRSSAQGE